MALKVRYIASSARMKRNTSMWWTEIEEDVPLQTIVVHEDEYDDIVIEPTGLYNHLGLPILKHLVPPDRDPIGFYRPKEVEGEGGT